MEKPTWNNTWEYIRILEILHDYWLNEPDELKVRVTLDFMKANGETQSKCIQWFNPAYKKFLPSEEVIRALPLPELLMLSPKDTRRENEEWWNETELLRRIAEEGMKDERFQ